MEQILTMARAIGEALQSDERYIATQMAQDAADEDEALQALIGEFNLKRIAFGNEQTKEDKDEDKLQALNAEIGQIYASIMANEHMKQYQQAKERLDELVNGVTRIIMLSSQGQNPQQIAEASGGCSGNCSGCSGCN